MYDARLPALHREYKQSEVANFAYRITDSYKVAVDSNGPIFGKPNRLSLIDSNRECVTDGAGGRQLAIASTPSSILPTTAGG